MLYMKFSRHRIIIIAAALALSMSLGGCTGILKDSSDAPAEAETAVSADESAEEYPAAAETEKKENEDISGTPEETGTGTESTEDSSSVSSASSESSVQEEKEIPVITPEPIIVKEDQDIVFDPSWQYGEFSKINSGTARLYYSRAAEPNDITVCINAGHGTKGGSSVKTQCHPDGTPKVTGGSTAEGETHAYAVSTGMDFADGTPEREGNLALALVVKEKLLAAGYNVLMIRETDDVQLDNIARTLIANAYADCHIAIHYDSTSSDKGAYFMSVPNVSSYRAMEPVASHWEDHNRLGRSVIEGLRSADVKVMGDGSAETDLTQTSYSTVPSIDLEVGDKVSDRSAKTLDKIADGITAGLDIFFEEELSAENKEITESGISEEASDSAEGTADSSGEMTESSENGKTGPAE